MNLGNQIVIELGRRGLVGQFFDYTGYQQLKLVENGDGLRQLLQQCDYQSVPQLETATEAADYLIAVDRKLEREEAPWFLAAMLTGLVAPCVDLFFWAGLLILQLNRKSRKRL
jgi:hypothetical protein